MMCSFYIREQWSSKCVTTESVRQHHNEKMTNNQSKIMYSHSISREIYAILHLDEHPCYQVAMYLLPSYPQAAVEVHSLVYHYSEKHEHFLWLCSVSSQQCHLQSQRHAEVTLQGCSIQRCQGGRIMPYCNSRAPRWRYN